MDEFEAAVAEVNEFLAGHRWCDFTVIKMSHDLVIGGMTGLSRGVGVHDITVTFGEVFYAQVRSFWETDTSVPSFVIPDIDEQRQVNLAYDIEQGHRLVRILAEDITGPMYVSARDLTVRTTPR